MSDDDIEDLFVGGPKPKKKAPTGKAKRDLQIAAAWQAWAATPGGQLAIADLMAWGHVYTDINESDPIELAKAVGANNFAKRVAYLLGLKEHHLDFPERAWEDTDLLNRMLSSRH